MIFDLWESRSVGDHAVPEPEEAVKAAAESVRAAYAAGADAAGPSAEEAARRVAEAEPSRDQADEGAAEAGPSK